MLNCFPCQVAHIPNEVQEGYYHINMSDFQSDLKDNSVVKFPANTVVNLYEQYVHDLADVLDRHTPLVSKLTKKILWIDSLILIDMQSSLGANLKKLILLSERLLRLLNGGGGGGQHIFWPPPTF